MSKPAVQTAIYNKLVRFASANGSVAMTGTVIGSLDEKTIRVYLDHMKSKDAPLFKKWGSKYKAAEEDDDDDPTADLEDEEDPTADLGEEDPPEPPEPPQRQKTAVAPRTGKKETTAGLDDLFGPDKPAKSVAALPKPAPAAPVAVPEGMMSIDGKLYPQKFRLRGVNGLDTDLEVFSKSEKWGLIVRIPVPSDVRKIMLPGGEVEVDLLTLRRDPDGMTVLLGKKYSNSKLLAVAELSDD